MQSLPLSALPDLLIGHVDIRARPDSVQPLRFPGAESAFYDPFNRWVASCRLAFACG